MDVLFTQLLVRIGFELVFVVDLWKQQSTEFIQYWYSCAYAATFSQWKMLVHYKRKKLLLKNQI